MTGTHRRKKCVLIEGRKRRRIALFGYHRWFDVTKKIPQCTRWHGSFSSHLWQFITVGMHLVRMHEGKHEGSIRTITSQAGLPENAIGEETKGGMIAPGQEQRGKFFPCIPILQAVSLRFPRSSSNYTDVSELSLITKRLLLGSMISSVTLKWGSFVTVQMRERSFWRSWNIVPSLIWRESRTSHTSAHVCTSFFSRSYCMREKQAVMSWPWDFSLCQVIQFAIVNSIGR